METKIKKEFPLTIDENLFKTWQMLRRHDDIKELCEITGKSNPIIYRALNYGYVRDGNLEKDISNFYLNRAEGQRKQAEEILKYLS